MQPALSPSRAADFMQCPMLYRFRVVDRLPEEPSAPAARGTLVHAVLERLFDLPAAGRTLAAASGLLRPEWERLREAEPEVAGLFADEAELQTWLASAEKLLEGYFSLEDPTRLEPAERERLVPQARGYPFPSQHGDLAQPQQRLGRIGTEAQCRRWALHQRCVGHR